MGKNKDNGDHPVPGKCDGQARESRYGSEPDPAAVDDRLRELHAGMASEPVPERLLRLARRISDEYERLGSDAASRPVRKEAGTRKRTDRRH